MKARFHIAASILLVLASAATTAGAAQAGASCNERHTVCLQAGKDESSCLAAWHQCKAGARVPVRTSSAGRTTAPVKVATGHH